MPRGRLSAMCWALIAYSLAFRFYLPVTFEPNLARDLLPPASIDALAAGSLLAASMAKQRTGFPLPRWLLVAVVIAVVVAWFAPEPTSLAAWLRWIALEILPIPLFCWAIAGAVGRVGGLAGRILENPAVRYVGRISYGIYLYHFLVLWSALRILGDTSAVAESGAIRLAVCGTATLAIATVSWFVLEKPLNALKRFVPYGRVSPEDAAATTLAKVRNSARAIVPVERNG